MCWIRGRMNGPRPAASSTWLLILHSLLGLITARSTTQPLLRRERPHALRFFGRRRWEQEFSSALLRCLLFVLACLSVSLTPVSQGVQRMTDVLGYAPSVHPSSPLHSSRRQGCFVSSSPVYAVPFGSLLPRALSPRSPFLSLSLSLSLSLCSLSLSQRLVACLPCCSCCHCRRASFGFFDRRLSFEPTHRSGARHRLRSGRYFAKLSS
jgi:hypothetical protein